MAAPAWWMKLKKWQRTTILAVGVLFVVYLVYMANARWSNGTDVKAYVEAGTNPDGSMYFRCVSVQSDADVCGGPANQSTLTVGPRDRVHITVHSFDGGNRAHDFKMTGWAYAPPYPWVESELKHETETETFTAWKSGTFKFFCELPGHEAAGMWGTLVVG